ncbi:hypothetical protein Tco_0952074 [Tanacetum coccineum]|uniref:Uncharacterized protein n=1 Tax=Tanacetum coccineum TaxID=301880 RepID=A0ABQ5E2R5_9ASTR
MDNPYITMKEYVQYEIEKALRNNQVFNWETAKYGKISWCLDIGDINYLRFFETKFPAIVYDDALKLELDFSSEPTLSSQHVDEVNWKNKTSLSEYDDENYNDNDEDKIEQWLDLKFDDHKKVDKEVMEEVVSTWLIRSYKKQFEEYMEIKRKLEVYGLYTDVECDPTNIDFAEWLSSKFSNHGTMDWYTKNALWLYWVRGDDEEMLTEDELSNLEEKGVENEIAEIFRIEIDIFHFETPLCKAFKEFNYFLRIDVNSFHFKSGYTEWSTSNWKEDGNFNGGNLPGKIQIAT